MRKLFVLIITKNDLYTKHAITLHEVDIFHNDNSHRVTYPVL